MLSPEYLNLIEFNDVVELYNRLNIEITADIINRVAQMQDITETTKKQLEILKQTNGTEIFNQALEETSMLTAQTKKLLKQLFEDMAKEDIEGYKELYEYRDKPFKLSDTQYRILNQGLKETNRLLKNFTNTIAFQSKQAYVEAVDSAYMKVASGAFNYATAIHTACQELANKGITLKDKLGRNVQLEVAVRRNVMTGIQQTANQINRDIEEYLGCDGYEVTAHLGARPSHADAQGKQYARSHNTKISRDYPLWGDVESLWSEYNCRHTYFGIILGISEPKHTDKELKDFKEATVTLNGKKMPYYEATQKQRQLENDIRKQKRTVQTLEKANLDNKLEKGQLAQLQRKYNNFCKETGLEKDYQRLQVAKIDNTKLKQESKYKDITSDYAKAKKYKVKEQQYYKDEKGNKYKVDSKNVKIKANEKEREVAELLGKTYGGNVELVPVVLNPQGIKTPDYIINGEKFDLKEIFGNGKNTFDTAISKKKKQSNNFIFDISQTKMNEEKAIKQIEKIYTSNNRMWIDTIILIKDNKILKIYKRK